jgi:NADPH:quinone reductase-like Zn-dependent oxidoreductase
MIRTSRSSDQKALTKNPVETREDLALIRDLTEEGKVKTIIDRVYPLEEIAEAHRYVEKGHKNGSVIITVN